MSIEVGYSLAFATGLLGAGHCLGMCGGLNGGLFLRYGAFPGVPQILAFHGARVGLYGLLGAGGALAGRVLTQSGLFGKAQGLLLILAGLLITLLGLHLLLWGRTTRTANPGTLLVAPPTPTRMDWRPLATGLVNGLVPCGLVFSVAVKAAATANPVQAALLMLAFGAGTLPAMATLSLFAAWAGTRMRGLMVRLAALTLTLLGLWTLYEGWVFFDVMRGLANG